MVAKTKLLFTTLILTLAASIAFSTLSFSKRPKCSTGDRFRSSFNDNDDESASSFDMSELSRRIETLQSAENTLRRGRQSLLDLPVVSFDAILPNQRLSGMTTDATFCRLLRDLGLGGLFCMNSVNLSKRMLRRNGVLCRIEVVDAKSSAAGNARLPTAVKFQVVGLDRCRLVGPSKGMKARVGRWRRSYDPDGEEAVLGFGYERFVDADGQAVSFADNDSDCSADDNIGGAMGIAEWSTHQLDCALEDRDRKNQTVIEMAESILPSLDKWQELASRKETYDNIDVVASTRVMRGQPGLRVDPAALIRTVVKDLGQRPPSSDPTNLALWGAALINPLPPLGVSPEIRGRILEAPNAMSRLKILEWGLRRSIDNLEGTTPL